METLLKKYFSKGLIVCEKILFLQPENLERKKSKEVRK
jgi:hypothetical protein